MNKQIHFFSFGAILFLSACLAQQELNQTPISYPSPGEFVLGDYAWSYGHIGEQHRRYATAAPKYILAPDIQSLTLHNPPAHRPYLISRPVDLGNRAGEFRLTFQCIPLEVHPQAPALPLAIKRLQGWKVDILKRFDLAVGDTLSVDMAIPVDGSSGRLKIAIEFAAGIRTGTVENLSLRYADTPGGEFRTLPIDGLTVSRRIYQASETVRLLAAAPEAERHFYSWSIVDHQGEEVQSGSWSASTNINIDRLPLGWYRLTSQPGTSNVPYQTSTAFVVVPEAARRQDGWASPFGIHVEMNAAGLHSMTMLGAGWTRLHNADVLKWKTVEPVRGQWTWPDSALALFLDSGKAVLGCLGLTPTWASSRPDVTPYPYPSYYFGPAAHLPRDMAAWENYVRRVVSHYRGRITLWEIWNEPDIHFLVADDRGKVNNYLSLLSTAHAVIKDIDTTLQVLAPAVAYLITDDPVRNKGPIPEEQFTRYRDPQFFQDLKATDAGQYLDIFSFHHYSRQDKHLSGPTVVENPRLKSLAGEIAEDFAAVDGVWVTEYNVLAPVADFSYDLAGVIASQVCLEHFELFARGVSKVFTYNANYNEFWFHPFDNFFDPPDPTLLFVSYAVMTWMLDGFKFHAAEDSPAGLRTYTFVNAAGKHLEILTSPRKDVTAVMGSAARIVDFLGQERVLAAEEELQLTAGEFVYLTVRE